MRNRHPARIQSTDCEPGLAFRAAALSRPLHPASPDLLLGDLCSRLDPRPGRFNGSFLARAFPLLPLALVQNVFFALGEEIGWRGFLVPALYRVRGFAWAGVASGLIWGIWHVPLIMFGGYSAGTPAWYAVTCFMISVTAMSVTVAWLRLRSGSLWPAALYHGAHNLTIQGIFDGSTIDTGWTKWITTEFGIGLTFATVAMSLYFWGRRRELASVGRS